jgi:hypothetical protein
MLSKKTSSIRILLEFTPLFFSDWRKDVRTSFVTGLFLTVSINIGNVEHCYLDPRATVTVSSSSGMWLIVLTLTTCVITEWHYM